MRAPSRPAARPAGPQACLVCDNPFAPYGVKEEPGIGPPDYVFCRDHVPPDFLPEPAARREGEA